MRSHGYSADAIVLGKRNYGEADKIISVFSKSQGKLFLIAKGTRRPSSRKRGHLEVFNLVRFSANESKGMDIMTEVSIIENYDAIKKDLKKTSVAYFLLEVIGKLTQEKEPHERVFYLLKDTLEKLQTSSTTRRLRESFIKQILIDLGFWPSHMPMDNPDKILEDVAERQFSSIRVGKKVLE